MATRNETIIGTGLTKRVRRTVSSEDPDAAERMREFAQRKHWGYDGAARGTVENLAKTLEKSGLPCLDKTIVIEGGEWRYLRDGENETGVRIPSRTASLYKYLEDEFGYQSFEWYAGRIIELSHQSLEGQNIPAAIELGYLMRELGFKERHEADTIHGRKFPRKPTGGPKKQRKPKRSAVTRIEQVLDLAQRFLNMGGFRKADGTPNIRALADGCKTTANIGYESARKIISDAVKSRDLK